jgi:O-antigen/teichoic acid export membrane protein
LDAWHYVGAVCCFNATQSHAQARNGATKLSLKSKILALARDADTKALFAKGLVALFIKIGAAGLTFLMFVLLSNATTQDEYGRFAIGFSLAVTLSTVAGLGLGTAVLRYYPQYQALNNAHLNNGFLRFATISSFTVPLLFSAVLIAAYFIAAQTHYAANIDYLLAAAILVPVMTIAEFAASAMRAFGYTAAAMAPRDIVWRIAGCAFALFAVWKGGTTSFAILSFLAATLLFIVGWQFLRAKQQFAPAFNDEKPAYDHSDWQRTIWPMWGASALYAFAQQFDIVVVGYFLSPAESAPYFAALRTAGMLGLLLMAGNLISAPVISKLFHAGDNAALQKTVRLLSLGIAIPTLVGFGLLALIGEFLLGLFNPAFVSSYYFMLILGVGFTFDAVAGPTGYMLQMVGHERSYLKIMALAYLITLILQVVLAPVWGVYGVAIPSALGLIFANILIIHKVRTTLGVDPSLFGIFFKVRSHV